MTFSFFARRLNLGTNPQFWLDLQSAYELRVAQTEVGKEIGRLPTRRGAG
jgi:plasmid maintenance system antidote protein VapI